MRLIAVSVLLVVACGAPPRPVPPPAPAAPVTPRRADPVHSRAVELHDRARELAAGGHGFSRDTATWVAVLDRAEVLILGPIGPTGARSGLETAAREIADRPDARAAADYLVGHGIGPARLYGLWILGAVDASAAGAAAATLRTDPAKVESVRGCMMGPPQPFAELVDEVLARPLRRHGRGSSI